MDHLFISLALLVILISPCFGLQSNPLRVFETEDTGINRDDYGFEEPVTQTTTTTNPQTSEFKEVTEATTEGTTTEPATKKTLRTTEKPPSTTPSNNPFTAPPDVPIAGSGGIPIPNFGVPLPIAGFRIESGVVKSFEQFSKVFTDLIATMTQLSSQVNRMVQVSTRIVGGSSPNVL